MPPSLGQSPCYSCTVARQGLDKIVSTPLQEIVQQIVRQRDMFRQLLVDAAGNPSAAASAAADLNLITAAGNALSSTPGTPTRVCFDHCIRREQ